METAHYFVVYGILMVMVGTMFFVYASVCKKIEDPGGVKWGKTEGRVVEVRVYENFANRSYGTYDYLIPEIVYSYIVEGEDFLSSRISPYPRDHRIIPTSQDGFVARSRAGTKKAGKKVSCWNNHPGLL